MTIHDYFASMERSLRSNAEIIDIQEPLVCVASSEYDGLIRCRVTLSDGSFLDIYEVVSTELSYRVRVYYSYAHVWGGQVAFRYDNAPHHPEIVTNPHHKHIGPAG